MFIRKESLLSLMLGKVAAILGMVVGLLFVYFVFVHSGHDRRSAESPLVGIGVVIEVVDCTVAVTRILPGSPSEKAGLRVGDRLVKVNDTPIRALSLEGVSIMTGDGLPGTTVRLTVVRDGQELEITVMRGLITPPPGTRR